MPAAAIIAGAVGAVTAAVTGTSIVAGFLINAGLAAAASLFAPKPPNVGGFNAQTAGLTGQDPASIDTRTTVRAAIEGARWILGRARTAGSLKFLQEVDSASSGTTVEGGDLWLAFALSEGSCDAIEAVWINAERAQISQSGNVITFGGDYSGKITMYAYLAADGTEGTEIRAACSNFTAAHKFNGLSWMAVHLHQPGYDDGEGRFWSRIPEIQVLVRGLKITWPGQTVPKWTENAAALRHWLEVTRGGLNPAAIDRTNFDAAYALCNQTVTITDSDLPDGYTASGLRYAINGILTAEMDFELVRREFDIAWQGWVVEAGGVQYFRPGSDVAPVATLGEADIIEISEVRPAPALQSRYNAVTMTLAQSADNDFLPYDVPQSVDQQSLTRDDNFSLPQDAGQRTFVNSPIAALRLQAIMLRRLRPSMTISLRVMPGDNLQRMTLKPADRLSLTHSEYGFDNFLVEITRISVDDGDLSIVLELDEIRTGAYSDDLDLPGLNRRNLAIDGPRSIPAMTGLTLDENAVVQTDGTTIVNLTAAYTLNGYEAEFEIRESGETVILATQTGVNGLARFPAVAVGTTYEVRGRHRAFDGHVGEFTAWQSRVVGGDLTPPANPADVTFTAIAAGFRLNWTAAPEPDYSHSIVYTASVDDFTQANEVGRLNANYFDLVGFGASQNLFVWVRHVDRTGNESGLTQTTGSTGSPTQGDPGTDGTGVEYIFTAKANADAITGAANLPLASWRYDDSRLPITRGSQVYYDGNPADLDETKPYLIRFRRPVSGAPSANANIGTVAWTQEPAYMAVGLSGEDGTDGTDGTDGVSGLGVEYIFTAKANGDAITGTANLPLASWNYDDANLPITRGSQVYYDGTPADLDENKPYSDSVQEASCRIAVGR